MMILITGQPGNGKTLRAMHELEQEYKENLRRSQLPPEDKDYQKPRPFYSNIKSAATKRTCTLPDCCADNPDAFPWLLPMPEHNDWTQLPEGAFVAIDEAHSDGVTVGLEHFGRLFPATGKPGESDDPRIRAMSTHRHFGKDLLLITQYPSKLHHNARQLVGRHIHMNRAMGLQAAGTFVWSRCQADPYDEKQREKAEEEIWRYPKHLYSKYKSASSHSSSYKFKFPAKLLGFLSSIVMMVALAGGAYAYFSGKADEAKAKAAKPAPVAQGALAPGGVPGTASVNLGPILKEDPSTPAEPEHVTGVRGCIDSHKGCRCWGRDGRLIKQTRQECEAMVAGGIPIDLFAYSSGPTSAAQVSPEVAAGVGAAHGDAVNGAVLAAPQIGAYGDLGIKPNPHSAPR